MALRVRKLELNAKDFNSIRINNLIKTSQHDMLGGFLFLGIRRFDFKVSSPFLYQKKELSYLNLIMREMKYDMKNSNLMNGFTSINV